MTAATIAANASRQSGSRASLGGSASNKGPEAIPGLLLWGSGLAGYFPMQNFEKMESSTSSGAMWPVISESARQAASRRRDRIS